MPVSLVNRKYFINVSSGVFRSAISRYFRFVFNIEYSISEDKKTLKDLIILIDEETSIDKEWLSLLYQYKGQKIIIIGLSENPCDSFVSLLDLYHLRSSLLAAINRKKDDFSPFLLIQEIEQKMQLFFKGHGEQSLFDVLNKTRQSIDNGPELFNRNIIEWEEYLNEYLKPGVEHWNIFKKRFNKYEIYLKVCGFEKETITIESNINNFQHYVYELEVMGEDQLKRMEEKDIKQNIGYLRKIDSDLAKIKQKIDSIYHE